MRLSPLICQKIDNIVKILTKKRPFGRILTGMRLAYNHWIIVRGPLPAKPEREGG